MCFGILKRKRKRKSAVLEEMEDVLRSQVQEGKEGVYIDKGMGVGVLPFLTRC